MRSVYLMGLKRLGCKSFQIIFIFSIGLLFSMGLGCGYQFSVQRSFPEGITHLNIAMFENRTTETGLETIITNDIIDEILKNRSIVITGREDANAFLTGVIKSIATETISHRGQYASDERRVSVIVGVKLVRPDGHVIWQNNRVQGRSTYRTDILRDRTVTEQNRLAALQLLSDNMAENIYNQLTSTF